MKIKPHFFATLTLIIPFFVSAKGITTSQLDSMFSEAVGSDTVPGITVAVGGDSGITYAKGFGFADLENSIKMTPQHKVRIGSVSKLIAAAGAMRLYDEGKIDLDAAVTQYVPTWPQDKPVITLRQLGAHTAGIRHYKEGANEFLLNTPFLTINAALGLFKDDPLLFPPGSQHSYSTFGWTLVSAAMEGADKKRDFNQIIEDEVFEPLALTHTAFDDQYAIIPHRAQPYTLYNGELINSPQTDHSYKWAGGGFISTPSDVVRFAVAHVNSNYLKPQTVKMMFTPMTLNNGDTVNFGFGWMIGFERYKAREKYKDNAKAVALMNKIPGAVMHSGGSMGGTTMVILCPEHKRAVAVVKNVNEEDSADVFILALKTLTMYHTADD